MSKSLFKTALLAAVLFSTAAGPVVAQPTLCSNAPKSYPPCPNAQQPAGPVVLDAG